MATCTCKRGPSSNMNGRDAKSSDQSFMRCDDQSVGGWESTCFFQKEKEKKKERKKDISYLSTTPSKPATRPGPAMASHCAIDKLPHSQGMRLSISSKFDTAGHMPKARMGVLTTSSGRSTEYGGLVFVDGNSSL